MKVNHENKLDQMPVVRNYTDFDRSSGVLLERIIFNYRHFILVACIIATVLLGYQAAKLELNASFEKMLPQSHPYIKNYLKNKDEIRGLGNTVRIVVENTQGSILDADFLEKFRQINDEVFLTVGVDRAWVKSIWMPVMRWIEITEEGFSGGAVMPHDYDGSEKSLQQLRLNIVRANLVGSYVATNFKSSMILVPLMDIDQNTGKRLDYTTFSNAIEKIRTKYETTGKGKVKIHVIGFAKIVGDLLDGLKQVMIFFAFAIIISAVFIYLYTRCVRSTVLLICCSALAVLWQLGIVATLGYELDPYSILVPFLVFAIGVSHGAQKMNGIMQDIGRGTHKLVAARYTFRRLFLPGVTALSADAVAFGVLMLIDIQVIRDLAMTASIGVAVLIFTNLILLPIMLSYTGVSQEAAKRSLRDESEETKGKGLGKVWGFLDRFTGQRWAAGTIAGAVILAVIGVAVGMHVKIGDLDAGAPELRADSRYNKDDAFFNANYALSSDQFAVIIKTPQREGCLLYDTLVDADRLAWALQQIPDVQSTFCVSDTIRTFTAATYEGSLKWCSIVPNRKVLDYAGTMSVNNYPDVFNKSATVMPLIAHLKDHKAETLERVINVAEGFSAKYSTKDKQFLLAAGNAGIEASTNIVVKKTNRIMMLYVYVAVILLCFITFRSWRAVLVAVLPLILTSILCEALMVVLGIGVKVATLPVIALGVGIGVDYALYFLSVQLAHMRAGLSLSEAYKRAVQFTGKVVGLVGVTLAGAVITWAWSPIKFQADMGILLTFMFLYNMVGALVLIPALSRYVLGKSDEYGHVYLQGIEQEIDVIISDGKRIYPATVEEIIMEMDAVIDVAVIGVPDVKLGEKVKAVVVRNPGKEVVAQEIIERCSTKLMPYQVPSAVEFVDDLPKSLGKVLKRVLRKQFKNGR